MSAPQESLPRAPRPGVVLALLAGLYRLAWYPLLPLVLAYFYWRGRRDRAYRQHMGERFGAGAGPQGAVWVHAVSLGEMRSAVPLVRALLEHGESVVTTHLTPAGRRACETAFAPEIAQGRVQARYLPLEFGWAWRRFFRSLRPKLGLALEIEVWPVMIAEAARAEVPLYLANSQYPARSFARDMRFARRFGHPVAGVTGVLAKSEGQAARFRAMGAPGVQACGELRFDQPIPPEQLAAAAALRRMIGARPVVTLASVVDGEDEIYLGAIRAAQAAARAQGRAAPLFVYVPRAPERFAHSGDWLEAQGQRVLRRSRALDAQLALLSGQGLDEADILLGDSMGEMYFYLGLCDLALVGGGFVPKGAHNVIEPLALRRPVLVGPHVWTIEYPGQEAIAAGVVLRCDTPQALDETLARLLGAPEAVAEHAARAEAFFAAHSGATARIMAAIGPHLGPAGQKEPSR
ncbi:3-deoxy-D-manno-octulosonic acid transferase [Alkalilacustris brevis]|uniref:3-deoxy-D-manno-octulosonic acid transferase n=1 Tax=Alkalilacustris brevis TaxID=2026338 RepID=UPI000E0D22E5|nr:glycosyltransferase N-terminal domain-containing protein [Alkalilacustris brevis]